MKVDVKGEGVLRRGRRWVRSAQQQAPLGMEIDVKVEGGGEGGGEEEEGRGKCRRASGD